MHREFKKLMLKVENNRKIFKKFYEIAKFSIFIALDFTLKSKEA